MLMYNLLECSQNHFLTSRSCRNYYADEIDINDNASEMVNHLNIKQKY